MRNVLLPLLCGLLSTQTLAQGTQADYERAEKLQGLTRDKVFRINITPNWLDKGRVWYRVQTAPDKQEWVIVQADGKLTRYPTEPEFKKALGPIQAEEKPLRLSAELTPKEVGERVELTFHNTSNAEVSLFWLDGAQRVAYPKVPPGGRHTQSTYAGHAWEVKDSNGKSLGFITAPAATATVTIDDKPPMPSPTRRNPRQSPDNQWIAFPKEDNIWIRPAAGGGGTALTSDGTPAESYARSGILWSPDSNKLVAFKTKPEQTRKVTIVESSPKDQLQPKVMTLDYLKPGDQIALSRPVLIRVADRKVITPANDLFPNPWSLPDLGETGWGNGVTWKSDSSGFFFAYNQRGHQLMRVVSVDATTGTPKALFEDTTKTFIHYSGKFWSRYLPRSNEIIWMSERDGWNHLYLHDASTGAMKKQITQGNWVVKSVLSFDEEGGTITLNVGGRNPGEDPYHNHVIRVSLKNGAITPLTEGDGTHRLVFSPDGTRYLDVYSRVDMPPVTELRLTATGKKLAALEVGDASLLLATGWKQPQRFVAKGRDGKTDIYGIIHRPTNFDPNKKYPVIEQIYAGPHGFFVPKQWSSFYGNPQTIAELGFLVVQIDGMGTDGRGKAFHEVSFKNLKDSGFPDRIAWMKALAAKEPAMDLSRVGIYGGSAGGQSAMAALLWHGDFYKAAVADCGCHDNRMDKIWWNEQWMSWPVDKSYEESSNMVNAGRLTGKLMLTVGELDTNVDPASTMQVANALIRAGKDFDLIVFPGGGHGAGDSPYGKRRRMDFFVRHLMGVEPRR